MKPLAIDLCSGLGGWAEGLEAEGWTVIRVDIEDMFAATGTPKPPGCLLMLQDILTFHGSQAKHANLVVASPPCQEYSYMAMPWSLAKAKAARIRADETGAELARLNALFNACFRIQRECNEARAAEGWPPIPMVVENVRGAQPWVGRAAWNFGSYYLWGDVPALMPKAGIDAIKVKSFRFDGSGSFQSASVNRTALGSGRQFTSRDDAELAAIGVPGHRSCQERFEVMRQGHTQRWFNDGPRDPDSLASSSSSSPRRKAASAAIAKIPFALSSHIARVYKPLAEVA